MPRIAPLLLLCIALGAPAAVGDTLRVPQDHLTIQTALDAAASGDVVLVGGGTYTEAVDASLPPDVELRTRGKVFVDARDLGAAFTLDGQGLLVEGFRVIGGDEGFVVTGADVTLSRCTVTGVAGRGIALSGMRHRADRCTVQAVGALGIHLSAGQGLAVTRCTVDLTGSHGISIPNTNVGAVVSRTRISASGGHGLVNNGGAGVVTRVTVDGTLGRGISDGPKANAPQNTYLDCRVLWSREQGFFNVNKGAAVRSLVVRDSGGIGIEIRGAGAEVERCRVRRARAPGLRAGANSGSWTNNRVTDCFQYGVVLDGKTNTLAKNVGRRNGGFDLRDNQPGSNTVAASNDFGTVWPIPDA